jgi:hypothetical protein
MRSVYCDDKDYESAGTAAEIAPPRNRLATFVAAAWAVMLLQASATRAEQVELEEVAAFPTQQVTGVAVSALNEAIAEVCRTLKLPAIPATSWKSIVTKPIKIQGRTLKKLLKKRRPAYNYARLKQRAPPKSIACSKGPCRS